MLASNPIEQEPVRNSSRTMRRAWSSRRNRLPGLRAAGGGRSRGFGFGLEAPLAPRRPQPSGMSLSALIGRRWFRTARSGQRRAVIRRGEADP
jgi:hypothetical protein